MKKIWLILVLLLTACKTSAQNPTLHVFYNKTCSDCLLFESQFIPQIKDVDILLHDMDENESIDLYKEYLSTLEKIDESLYELPLTPFIYMENGFGAIGYSDAMDKIYLQLIEETLQNKKYTIIPSGVWICKED